MPSLDLLQSNSSFNNLKIFPINIGQEESNKSKMFFKELDNNIHQKHMINFRFSKKLSSLWLAKIFDYNPK